MKEFAIFLEKLLNTGIKGSCDWIMCPKEDGSRNIANPYQTGNPLERDRDYWEDPEDMEKDNGNVHNNSTVLSHSAYLMERY